MSEQILQTILPVEPGTINESDRAALKEIGILVIEHKFPGSIRLITPIFETDSSEMLKMATLALDSCTGPVAQSMREYFARLVIAHIQNASHE